MYNMNFYLKLLIVLLSIIITIISNNYIVLWLLLFILTFINFWSNNRKQFAIDLLLIILLAVSSRIYTLIVLYKLLFLFNICYTFIESLTSEEKTFIKNYYNKDDFTLRDEFNNNNFNSVYEYNENKRNDNYSQDSSFDNKIVDDLERRYLQARIRFYGFNKDNSISSPFSWTKLDSLVLLFAVIVFIILLYIGR